jgi:hypothetical protein
MTQAKAKVTLVETPSETLLKTAEQSVEVADAQGRRIMLKRPDVLAQFRLVEALGDTARNAVYMNMVMPTIFVSAIDGEPVARPNSKIEIEALIKRLDEDGILAVSQGVAKHFGAQIEGGDEAKNA